jgi:hypothetical protein
VLTADEYLMSGFVSSDLQTVELVDFYSNSELPTKCFEWTQEIALIIQEKYGRKRVQKKPSKQSRNSQRMLWELKTKDVFENPNPVNIGKCSHKYLKLDNHWMVYREYKCTDCKEKFMCECDKELTITKGRYQTNCQWLGGICPSCRGFEDVSIITDGKLMYGSSFYAVRWREIAKEADRLAIENKDEPDYSRAENNIRLKYGIPLIGEGWVSETQLYKNLEQLLPDYKVIHHGKPEWLGRMHLDVYIPELRVAFEYQGKQHYQAVDYFGGQDSFEKTQIRDIEKARLCKENSVTLVYINEGDDFSKEKLLKILNLKVE